MFFLKKTFVKTFKMCFYKSKKNVFTHLLQLWYIVWIYTYHTGLDVYRIDIQDAAEVLGILSAPVTITNHFVIRCFH